jgi:hypothetical protein
MTRASARFSVRDLCAFVAVGGAGVVSVLTTFTPWRQVGFPPSFEFPTGWEYYKDSGLAFHVGEDNEHLVLTGWATLLAGVLLIAVAVLLVSTVNGAIDSATSGLPYRRWVIVVGRLVGWAALLLLGFTTWLLFLGDIGIWFRLALAWWTALIGLLVLALPPEDFR